jgi:hypothetical protein
MRRLLRDQGLAFFFLAIFLAALAGQAVAGFNLYNDDQVEHARLLRQAPETVSFGRYLASSHFAQATTENWQSEYLQFALYVFATVWLIQRGSAESKEPGQEGKESDREQQVGEYARPDSPRWARLDGWRRRLYENSLLLVVALIWLWSWFAQSVSGNAEYNDEQSDHRGTELSWLEYLGSSDFWFTTLQNWQSEFLAVGSFATFTIYLRQRGSPESKPVGAAHGDTGVEG